MKGILYKQYNLWLVEYSETKGSKILKKSIELHPDDVDTIDDSGEYANDFNYKNINFDIVIISDEFKKSKVVAKIIQPELPVILVTKENEDDE